MLFKKYLKETLYQKPKNPCWLNAENIFICNLMVKCANVACFRKETFSKELEETLLVWATYSFWGHSLRYLPKQGSLAPTGFFKISLFLFQFRNLL